MPHARKQIRDACEAALADLATTGANVFSDRAIAKADNQLPSLLVYVDSTRAERGDIGSTDREMSLKVRCRAAGAGAEDSLDQMAAEVEAALLSDVPLKALIKDIQFTGDDTEFAFPADKVLGQIILTFTLLVMTPEGDPTTIE